MKIYGYAVSEQSCLKQMHEVSFQVSPDELKRMAEFFLWAASMMESKDVGIPDHFHLRDHDSSHEDCSDIIVCSEPG